MPQHVRRDVEHILGEHVAPAAEQRQRPAAGHQAQAGAGARAVGEVRLDHRQAVVGR